MSASSQTDGKQAMEGIVAEEQRVLARVLKHLAAREARPASRPTDYDSELVTLRDQIAEARLEDVPALIAEMERLQQVAARRADVLVNDIDVGSPYFGRIVLQEGARKREVLIGRATYLDSKTGVQIVDWRDAPVSRIYYRYDEGDDYDEEFGDRVVEGEVLTRRSLAISSSRLRRIGSTQGTFLRRNDDTWVELDGRVRLEGGQGTAPRPSHYEPVGKLGLGIDDGREDRHLPEIAALIDPRQFELITRPDSRLVVIQGGAGSGKTTIGLHRLAYLAYQDSKRFLPERMLVVVFNDALARYIEHVLPALGVEGVPVVTFHGWAKKLRLQLMPLLPTLYTEDTPDVVVRLKKHPAWLRILDDLAAGETRELDARVQALAEADPKGAELAAEHAQSEGAPPGLRGERLLAWASVPERGLAATTRHGLERAVKALSERTEPVTVWSEILTDRTRLGTLFAAHAPGDFSEGQLDTVARWCARRINAVLDDIEARREREEHGANGSDEELDDFELGVDGVEEKQPALLDWEDDTLLLRIQQRLRAPLRRGKDALRYEHAFVDESQDLSPLELAVVLDTVRSGSVTLAGDVAQRVMMDNGFSDWKRVLGDLGLAHVEIEPLRISYRSTHEIIEFAQEVLGPVATEPPGKALRHGVPVELFRFSDTGGAVGYLAEQLRALATAEPLASVAVITRRPEQAREYAEGLTHAEVPNVRLIAEQDFPFKAGVDVTDVRQVKGLEFDYVVLVEVTTLAYPEDAESRHLLHIAATRAAHQLWILTNDAPSPLLPAQLCERGY